MCDLDELGFEGRVMNAVLGLCVTFVRTELGCQGRVMTAVLGLCVTKLNRAGL